MGMVAPGHQMVLSPRGCQGLADSRGFCLQSPVFPRQQTSAQLCTLGDVETDRRGPALMGACQPDWQTREQVTGSEIVEQEQKAACQGFLASLLAPCPGGRPEAPKDWLHTRLPSLCESAWKFQCWSDPKACPILDD